MSNDSYIETTAGSTTFAGPDAVALYRATAIRHAIMLYLRTGIIANRAYTPTNMARIAGTITGKTYTRGKSGLVKAALDLDAWYAAMKAALPIVDGSRVSLANMNPAAMAAAARNAKSSTDS